MKKLINNPLSVVREMLEGAVALAPGQTLLSDENVVVRSDLVEPAQRRVAVISGGGSGHEPAHAGYVGRGMLTAAVAGDVFTSPSSDAVLSAIKACAGPAGAVLIVKNYTGDRLNFGLAAEMARADGIPVEVVIVADDVALRHTVEAGRRRGIGGTVLVHKIAGACAEAGGALADVAALARAAAADIGTMGVALGSCTLPAVGRPSYTLEADEIEVGLGIHGEPGVERAKIAAAESLVQRVLETIVGDRKIARGGRVALLANGLGSTPPMELAIATRDALRFLERRGIVVERAWCGTFMSALDMPGFSLSLLPVDDPRLKLLDAATDAPGWPGGGVLNRRSIAARKDDPRSGSSTAPDAGGAIVGVPEVRAAVMSAARALIEHEAELTDLDAKAGDGDLGSSMARGAAAVMALPASAWASPSIALTHLAHALRRAIAGSSGPFYATALLRAARRLSETETPTPADWAAAFSTAVTTISELGGAQVGDRTMVDALRPAADAFEAGLKQGSSPERAWTDALAAARAGRDATSKMQPRLGRASYLGDRAVGVPDAGASAVVCWLEALSLDLV
jgi:ATP-dependent dihydroxyacetone kinase